MKVRTILYRAAVTLGAVAAAIGLNAGIAQAQPGHANAHHHGVFMPQPNDPEGGPS